MAITLNNLHKYDEEIETLYGEHDFNPNISFTKNYAKNNIWAAFYTAAREIGMSEDMAKQFIDSKWFRHNEEEIYQQLTATLFTMLWCESSFVDDTEFSKLEPYIDRGDVEWLEIVLRK